MAGDRNISDEARFEQLIPSYTLTPEMSRQIAEAFEGLGRRGVTYEGAGPNVKIALAGVRGLKNPLDKREPESLDSPPSELTRLYRAEELYGAMVMAQLFECDKGRTLHQKFMEVMSGDTQGMLLKGLPEDPGIKSMVIFGLKSLLGDKGEYPLVDKDGGYYPDKRPILRIPEIIRRRPLATGFHRDNGIADHLDDPESSFLFMASNQRKPLSAPTLFKVAGDPDESAVGHCLEPDEIILCNNKTLEHASGPTNPGARATQRQLMRYTIERMTRDYPLDHLVDVEYLRGVPDEPAQLKEWIKKETIRLQRQTGQVGVIS